jgi:hypothetical protein
MKPTELIRFVKAVSATGLPVRNVEYSTETRLVRVNIASSDTHVLAVDAPAKQENSEDLRKLL